MRRITKTVTADGEEKVEMEASEEDNPEKLKEKKDKAIEAIQKNQEMMQLKHDLLKKAEEKRKEALVQQEGLIKSKQILMEGLIEQQKALIVCCLGEHVLRQGHLMAGRMPYTNPFFHHNYNGF